MNIYISRDSQQLGLYNEDDALAQKASGSDLQRAVAQIGDIKSDGGGASGEQIRTIGYRREIETVNSTKSPAHRGGMKDDERIFQPSGDDP
jgi:hypothetical protein